MGELRMPRECGMTKAKKLPGGAVAVYRAYDADDSLVYVGITDDPDRRLNREHRKYSYWYERAAYFDVRVFPDRVQALLMEARAIERERPSVPPLFDQRLLLDDHADYEHDSRFTIRVIREGPFD